MNKLLLSMLLAFLAISTTCAQNANLQAHEPTIAKDLQYKPADKDADVKQACKLDIYYDKKLNDCPVVVWYHGGGLTSGSKELPAELKDKGITVVGVNYRLLPNVKIDDCLDDCAAALAWVFHNINRYGGSNKKIFVSGHSAGGYITTMLGLDKEWLTRYEVDADSIACLVPFSGQMISHFAYRKMQGIDNLQPTIDKYAPLFHVRKGAAPLVLITGDRNVELFGRYEENAYMWRMMRLIGRPDTELYEIGGHGHVPMCKPAFHILLQTINKILGKKYEF